MKRQINYLGFLSLLSLIAILGIVTENRGLIGFLGFVVYIHYFKVIPDELFMDNLYKACTLAFLIQIISFIPILFILYFQTWFENPVLASMGISFIIGLIVFTLKLRILQRIEGQY